MAYKSIFDGAPTPPTPTSPGYKSVFDGPTSVGAGGEPDEGGVSLFGFLGNVGQEVGDMAKGISSLVGMGVHDIGGLVAEATTFGKAETDYQLDDVAMALPKALATDYNERYGISKFADGDVWGGLGAILKGLYERPLSAIGDALMVGTAAKLGAKAGLLGETLGAKVLGPGTASMTSLTGGNVAGAEITGMALSQNPVARLAQSKLYDLLSYERGLPTSVGTRIPKLGWTPATPERAIEGMADAGLAARARTTLGLADPANRVLRPTVSRFLERGGTNKVLSLMRMNAQHNAGPGTIAVRKIVEDLADDPELQSTVISVIHGTKSPLLDEVPPNLSPVGRALPNDPDVPVGVVPSTPEVDAEAGMALASHYRETLIPIQPNGKFQLESPHSLNPEMPTGANGYFLQVGDDADIGGEAAKAAQLVDGQIIGKMDYGAQPGSYDLPHYSIQTKNGVLDVAIGTPDQLQSAQAWSHIAQVIRSKTDEVAAIDGELKMLARAEDGGSPAAAMALDRQRIELLEEIDAAQAFSDSMFDFSRRSATGQAYNRGLAAADKIRPIVYNTATRNEIIDGALTFRKAMDRAFGPIRLEKWSIWMRDIEKMLKAQVERNLDIGIGPDETQGQIIDVLNHVLGENNPWTERTLLSSRKEVIPFETEDVMPAGIGHPGPLRGQLATGEAVAPSAGQTLRSRRSIWDDVEEDVRPTTNSERADEIANRLTNRLRAETRTAMVENGEFDGLDWKTLAKTQVDGMLPMPQYYPHIKASKLSGDIVMGPHSKSLQTVIESEGPRMQKWHGDLYESGLWERDPIAAYEQLFRQIQSHSEMRDALTTMVDKYGRIVPPDELQGWRMRRNGEVLVTQSGINGLTDGRSKFLELRHEAIMDGRSVDDAALDALDVLHRQAVDSIGELGGETVYALPRHVAELMKKLGQKGVLGDSFNFYFDTATGVWKSMVLSLSPRWVVNNTLGNMVYMGVHRPGAIKEFIGQLMPGARARAKIAFGERALDGWEQNFMHSESLLRAEQRFGLRAQRATHEGVARFAESPLQQAAPVRAVRAASSGVRRINSYIEAAARRGVAINEVRRMNIVRTASRFDRTHTLLQKVAEEGLDVRQYDSILKEINATLGDYVTMNPIEANVIRRYLVPFYSFYRHTGKFVARMPFEHPLKMRVLELLTQLERDMNPYMPEYMQGSIPLGGTSFLALGGANPIEAVAEAYWPQMTHPLLGAAIQRATGRNPFGRPWVPPAGAVVETWRGNYAVQRNSSGQVIGVQQMEGDWAPPLGQFLLNQAIPQTTLIFDPWNGSLKKRVIGLTGVSLRKYDPAADAFYKQTAEQEALSRAYGTPPS